MSDHHPGLRTCARSVAERAHTSDSRAAYRTCPTLARNNRRTTVGHRNARTADVPGIPSAPAPAEVPATAASASAQLSPTQGHNASGTNGEFGFHIHEKGDCSAPDASSAGEHFNPANAQHGNPQGEMHHAGDLLNAKSDGQGVAAIDAVASSVSLDSGQPNGARGKAVVLRAEADDCTSQPAGNSGARIACGVID